MIARIAKWACRARYNSWIVTRISEEMIKAFEEEDLKRLESLKALLRKL
jgi:hypothetical protein